MKFTTVYGPVFREVSKHHYIIFNMWQIATKSNKIHIIFSPDYHTFHKVWLKSDETNERSSTLEILTWEMLQSAANDPKLNSNKNPT